MTRTWFSTAAMVILSVVAPLARAETPAAWADAHLAELFDLYKHFHAHPELSQQETQTAARLADELKSAGFAVTTAVGGTGVVAIMENGEGPRVMFRSDLDGLPVTEKTDLAYASKVKVAEGSGIGVMHACGHDIHITNLIAVARYMAAHKNQWRGTLMLIGQPAEERGEGAKAMLDDGLFTRWPKPDLALALHCDHKLSVGSVGCRPGYMLANVDSVDITIYGKGGHGAHPDTTIDPVLIAAHLVVDLQSIVAREVKPGTPAVITVGSIHGGTKHNIIGDTCELQLTVRSYTDEVRKQLLDGIRRKANAAAAAAGAPEPKVSHREGTPATFNNEELTARVTQTFRRVLGDQKVTVASASMGGEDFSRYGLAGVPICMYFLGTVEPQRLAGYERVKQEPPSLHSPFYYPDAEPTLRTAVVTACSALLDLMPAESRP